MALGADARQIVSAILSRGITQVAAGVALGAVGVLALTRAVSGLAGGEMTAIAGYIVFMLGVCLMACLIPTARGLRIHPVEA